MSYYNLNKPECPPSNLRPLLDPPYIAIGEIGGVTYCSYLMAEWQDGTFLSGLNNNRFYEQMENLIDNHGNPFRIRRMMHKTGSPKLPIDYRT